MEKDVRDEGLATIWEEALAAAGGVGAPAPAPPSAGSGRATATKVNFVADWVEDVVTGGSIFGFLPIGGTAF